MQNTVSDEKEKDKEYCMIKKKKKLKLQKKLAVRKKVSRKKKAKRRKQKEESRKQIERFLPGFRP